MSSVVLAPLLGPLLESAPAHAVIKGYEPMEALKDKASMWLVGPTQLASCSHI